MPYPELAEIPHLHDCWVAIDPGGGRGLASLSSGAVVVDYDGEIDELCRRIAEAQRGSLTIVYTGSLPRA
jgi:hypothetical protein